MSSLSQGKFDPETLAKRVPPAALRYLIHAIRPGATLARRAEITFLIESETFHAVQATSG